MQPFIRPGFEDRDEDDWDMIYQVNVKEIIRVTGAVKPGRKERRYGKSANMVSVPGRQDNLGIPSYAVSKIGVASYMQPSTMELAPYNVDAIGPGSSWTPMWERIAVRWSAA